MVGRRGFRRYCLGQILTRHATGTLLFGMLVFFGMAARLPAQNHDTVLSDFYPGLRGVEQSSQRPVGAMQQPRHIYQTYSGTVTFRFPNYDIRIPISRGEFPSENTPGAPVVVKNAWGMYWDGSNHFISPSYAYREVTRNRYILNVIGEWPPLQWPFEEPCRGVAPPAVERRHPKATPTFTSVALQPDHSPATLGITFSWPPQLSTPEPQKEAATAFPKFKFEPDDFPTFDAKTSTRPIAIQR